MVFTAEEFVSRRAVVCRERWETEAKEQTFVMTSLVLSRGSCFLTIRYRHAVHPLSLWMPQSSSHPLPLFWFHAHRQPLDYNLALHVDFPTGENALTSQCEHLVRLARSILFVSEHVGVLVSPSVSSCTAGAAEGSLSQRGLFPFVCTLTQHGLSTREDSLPQLRQVQDHLALDLCLLCKGFGPTVGAVVQPLSSALLSSSEIWPRLMIQCSSSHTMIPCQCVYLP